MVKPARQPADRTAYSMLALGKAGMPRSLTLAGNVFELTREVKHDFWAATGFYEDTSGTRVVFKAGRAHDFAGIPLQWIGRWLRDREVRVYSKLGGVANIPRVLGTVGETGFVMQFLPGRQLAGAARVPDGFFAELRRLVEQIHARQVAYVDMNKRANILIGEDDRPYLVDFQISYDLHGIGDTWLGRRVLAWLQREDLYHVAKHHARLRPDELTREQIESAKKRSALLRLHRIIAWPWFGFRRRTMSRLRESGRVLPETSE